MTKFEQMRERSLPTRNVQTEGQTHSCIDLPQILQDRLPRLPHVLRLLSENHLRGTGESISLLAALDSWLAGQEPRFEFVFRPNRILMHDTTCTPALADIAAMRDVLAEAGLDPSVLSPRMPVEVSVDHSLAVDHYGQSTAFARNIVNELTRNKERYTFMKWAADRMETLNVNPPGTGIMHTINLEQLATLVLHGGDGLLHPEMMIGTDSHTPMINGIGVLGWGVGGLEAESAMFGQPVTLAFPEVVGVRLDGRLPAGVLATDLALEVTHRLREIDVTGSYVEFFGPGVATLSADDRAVIANMAPEYGASTGFFPVDEASVAYLRRTGRAKGLTDSIEPLMKALGLWFTPDGEPPQFDRTVGIDLAALQPLIAGPRRPQDRVQAGEAHKAIETAIDRPLTPVLSGEIPDGAIGIAAITSCTNTSSPGLLVAAGLLARKARDLGLTPPPWVKTSLAPGSPSAHNLLARAGLLQPLEDLGFGIVGYGCTTCIGNSGPLPAVIETGLAEGKAIAAVLSGNRNFPGRVHPKLDLGFLASPPMVVAFALKGTVHGDILREPLGEGRDARHVALVDIWPTEAEIADAMAQAIEPAEVPRAFAVAKNSAEWRALETPTSDCFPWDPGSVNLRRPAFVSRDAQTRLGNYQASPLLVLGDDMTTDHISPAGWIDPDSEAGRWLIANGAQSDALNVYASYRGNWEVMLRGLFTNRSALNFLDPNLAPAETRLADGTKLPVHEAARRLSEQGQSAVILAGERYGMGSSRDWAAKGAALLGVRAVIARSFERIHRTNLIGMGILPVEITDDFVPHEADLDASDLIGLDVPPGSLQPHRELTITINGSRGSSRNVSGRAAIETAQEISYLCEGGVFSAILSQYL